MFVNIYCYICTKIYTLNISVISDIFIYAPLSEMCYSYLIIYLDIYIIKTRLVLFVCLFVCLTSFYYSVEKYYTHFLVYNMQYWKIYT